MSRSDERGEAEERGPSRRRVLQQYTSGDLTVTFEPARCFHSAACIRSLPAVFDSKARPWVRPDAAEADAIVDAVHRCPSGALRVYRGAERVELAADSATITTSRNGPLLVRGDVVVESEDGVELLRDTRIALCRCGQSARMPLCDGSHRAAGFRAPRPTG